MRTELPIVCRRHRFCVDFRPSLLLFRSINLEDLLAGDVGLNSRNKRKTSSAALLTTNRLRTECTNRIIYLIASAENRRGVRYCHCFHEQRATSGNTAVQAAAFAGAFRSARVKRLNGGFCKFPLRDVLLPINKNGQMIRRPECPHFFMLLRTPPPPSECFRWANRRPAEAVS